MPTECGHREGYLLAGTFYAARLGVVRWSVLGGFLGSKITAAASKIPIRPKHASANRAIMRTGLDPPLTKLSDEDAGDTVIAITDLSDDWAFPDLSGERADMPDCRASGAGKPATLTICPACEEAGFIFATCKT